MVTVHTIFRIVSADVIPNYEWCTYNGKYCDIISFGGNSECRSTCYADGTSLDQGRKVLL